MGYNGAVMPKKSADLSSHRQKIDALDLRIVDLLEQRAALAKQIGERKASAAAATGGSGAATKKKVNAAGAGGAGGSGGAVNYYVPEREAQVLNNVSDHSRALKPHIRPIYRAIIAACLTLEKPLRVAFLGPRGTFSHEAAVALFGESAELIPAGAITGAAREVEKNNADVAVVPFENSAAGAVGETMDLLQETPLQISGEFYLRIRHHLLAAAPAALANISVVHAHSQPLEQCRRWLKRHLPNAELKTAASSAAAALALSRRNKTAAAIGSSLSQKLYDLSPLARNIEDAAHNSTRFLVLSRRLPAACGRDKTSFIMSGHHQPGAMYKLLQPLSDHKVNMTKLESRPSAHRLWRYIFFVDIEGHQSDKKIGAALALIQKRAAFLKILGSYPQAPTG